MAVAMVAAAAMVVALAVVATTVMGGVPAAMMGSVRGSGEDGSGGDDVGE